MALPLIIMTSYMCSSRFWLVWVGVAPVCLSDRLTCWTRPKQQQCKSQITSLIRSDPPISSYEYSSGWWWWWWWWRGAPRNESALSSDWTVNKEWLMELCLVWIHHSGDGGWTGNKNPIRGTVGGTRWESQRRTLWHVHARIAHHTHTHTFSSHLKYPTEPIYSCVRFQPRFQVQIRRCSWAELGQSQRTGPWMGHPVPSHTSLEPLVSWFFFVALPPWRRCFSPARETLF